MKILGICASHKPDKGKSLSWYLLTQALSAAVQKDCFTEAIHLRDYNIIQCEGCNTCMGGEPCPLLSRKDDQTRQIVDAIRSADGLIFSFPTYGLHAPGILLQFIGGRAKAFLGEDLVIKGRENLGDTTLFKGKIVGLISNGGGYGMEMAFASVWPALYASKAIIVASAGISTLEYQKSPFIERTPISKNIEDTPWAKSMAAGVGQRVYDALTTKARPIIEGMMGIRSVKGDDEIFVEADKYGLKWTQSGWEEFNKIPVFAREVALEMIGKNAGSLGFSVIDREAIIEGRKRFANITM